MVRMVWRLRFAQAGRFRSRPRSMHAHVSIFISMIHRHDVETRCISFKSRSHIDAAFDSYPTKPPSRTMDSLRAMCKVNEQALRAGID
jgi:hypothetical protein